MVACLLVPVKLIVHISGSALESWVNLISIKGPKCDTADVLTGSMRVNFRKGGGPGEASTSSGEGSGGGCPPVPKANLLLSLSCWRLMCWRLRLGWSGGS